MGKPCYLGKGVEVNLLQAPHKDFYKSEMNKRKQKRGLCIGACRILVKTKITENHPISKTPNTKCFIKQDIIFFSHAYLMLMGLWQTCHLSSKTCTKQVREQH